MNSGGDPYVHLMTIEDVFAFCNGRNVLAPDFTVSAFENFKPCELEALLETPDGTSIPFKVHFDLVHFNIRSSTDTDRRWRIVAYNRGCEKTDISIGSIMKVKESALQRLGFNQGKQSMSREAGES